MDTCSRVGSTQVCFCYGELNTTGLQIRPVLSYLAWQECCLMCNPSRYWRSPQVLSTTHMPPQSVLVPPVLKHGLDGECPII